MGALSSAALCPPQTRRSMVFARHLRAVGDEFRSRYLNSTDEADRIPFEEDWTKMKVAACLFLTRGPARAPLRCRVAKPVTGPACLAVLGQPRTPVRRVPCPRASSGQRLGSVSSLGDCGGFQWQAPLWK